MVFLDDLSGFGPPISDNTGRLYMLFTVAAFVYVTAHTQRPLLLRLFVTGLIASDVYLLLTMPDVMGHVPGFDPLIANFVAADLLRVIDLYFIRDHSKELKKKNDEVAETKLRNGKSINGKQNKSTAIAKFPPMTSFQAFDYLIMNHRNIGTPYRVRNVPNFKDSDPSYVPSRASFLLRKLVTIFLAYGLLDLLTCQPPPEPWLFTRHQEYFITRLNEVTWKEIHFRIITNLNLWASTYLLTQYVFAIIAFVGVASGVYGTADFPPLEGPVKYTWSIRTWWGRFWHQILQSPLTSNANAITRHTLPASLQRSLLARYSKIFWVFVLSGLCHMVSPLGSTGGYQHARGSAWFFPTQALGILIEDLVMAGYKKVVGRKEGEKVRTWERLVGYLWAWSWMSYTCSIWVYPTMRMGGEGMLPYSFIRKVFIQKEIWNQ